MTATWQERSIVLSLLHVRILMALVQGRHVPRKELMDALGVASISAMTLYMSTLRRRFATAHIPLSLKTFADGYGLLTDGSFVSSGTTRKLDAVGLRIVQALIQKCSDPVIADMARRHFLE
jgi:hypothetical protein